MANPSGKLQSELVGGEPYEYRALGDHVVSAPGVCGGEPTFKYTRINVRFIVARIRAGDSCDAILSAYEGRISPEALAEALRLDAEGSLGEAEVPVRQSA